MISVIYGKRGSGKTYLAKYLIKDINRLVIYDTLAEYADCIEDTVYTPSDLISLLEIYGEKDFKIRCVFPDNNFDIAIKILYACSNLTLVIDELDEFTKFNYTPDYLKSFVRYGRHFNLDFIGICRRPAEIPKTVTSQADDLYTFIQFEPGDIDYLKKVIPQADEKIPTLLKFQYLKYNTSSGQIIFNKL